MYRGCITEIGTITQAPADGTIAIEAPKSAGAVERGGSVNISGVCLSVTEAMPDGFLCDVSEETRRRSTLDAARTGTKVNVEVPLRVGDPLDGHLVQGHVDGVGKVMRVVDEGTGTRVWIRPPGRFLDDLTPKGSVAVDGVSLTVAEIVRDRFSVVLIPSTLSATTLGTLEQGARVNLESDLVGKLARTFGSETSEALKAVVGSLPWAGVVSGRTGVEKVVRQFASGGVVVVWDPDREGEADLVAAGAGLRPETFQFLVTRACGHPTVPCDRARLDRLEIEPLRGAGDRHGTSPHTPVDLAASTGTGVSAQERSATIRRLADADARPADFVRPGHVFPLSARTGGLRERAGHTEATIALCEAAKLPTVGVICEVIGPDGTMAGYGELERFALRWGLPMISIGDLTHGL